jgi:putative oxidoreductase
MADSVAASIGLLILRVALGLILFGHGSQKLFGWWKGYGLRGTAGFFGGMLGFRPAGFWTVTTALAETVGGALLAVGLVAPLAAIALAAAMAVATVAVHLPKGLWINDGGAEMTLVYFAAAVALALLGPGAYSLDGALAIHLPGAVLLIVAIVGALAVIVSLATRRPAPAAAAQPAATQANT